MTTIKQNNKKVKTSASSLTCCKSISLQCSYNYILPKFSDRSMAFIFWNFPGHASWDNHPWNILLEFLFLSYYLHLAVVLVAMTNLREAAWFPNQNYQEIPCIQYLSFFFFFLNHTTVNMFILCTNLKCKQIFFSALLFIVVLRWKHIWKQIWLPNISWIFACLFKRKKGRKGEKEKPESTSLAQCV